MPYRDKEKQKAACLKSKRAKIMWVNSQKRGMRCALCGFNKHSAALEFHHKNPCVKVQGISRMANSNASKEAILQEMKKCILVCANCHAIMDAERRNHAGL